MTSIFQRYADDESSELRIHMPQRVLAATVSHYPIDVLVGHWEMYLVDPSSARDRFPWAARFVMGMPVPTWARCVQWNVGQQARFITAVWSGGDLGSYLTNDWSEPASTGRALAENSEILVDGQQRLHSLEEYFLDRLAVPDAQGQPRIWSELSNGERKRFLSTIFTHAKVSSGDEVALRRTYDLCAQGVVPRSFEQRALRQSSTLRLSWHALAGTAVVNQALSTTGLGPPGFHPHALRPSWSARSACMLIMGHHLAWTFPATTTY